MTWLIPLASLSSSLDYAEKCLNRLFKSHPHIFYFLALTIFRIQLVRPHAKSGIDTVIIGENGMLIDIVKNLPQVADSISNPLTVLTSVFSAKFTFKYWLVGTCQEA